MKAFAALWDVIEGTTTASGIEEYLVLLSVSETCRYKDLDVLEFFLGSARESVKVFILRWFLETHVLVLR